MGAAGHHLTEEAFMDRIVMAAAAVIVATAWSGATAHAESKLAKFLPPDEQSALRGEKHVTIGVPFVKPYNLPGHLQIRPLASLAIGASYDSSPFGDSKDELADGYSVEADQHSATLYAEYYPLETSGFHLGLGAEKRFGAFTLRKADEQGEQQIVGHGEYEALYGGPSFGWTWLWANGLTLGADLSTRKRYKAESRHEASTAEDAQRFDRDVLRTVAPDRIVGTLLLGYSF
jgi:hypothetical protein